MDLSLIKYDIELFIVDGPFDLQENGMFLSTVESKQSTVETSYGKIIFSCWTDHWSRSWRVLSSSSNGTILKLNCSTHFGRATCILTLSRGRVTQELAQSRAEFTAYISRLVEAAMPSIRVHRASVGQLNRRHVRGVHTR